MKKTENRGRIELGPDTLSKLPELLRQAGGHKVLLVHGHRPVEDGLLIKVRLVLNQAGFPHANMGQILPDPKYSEVKRGIKTARKEKCDIILSLGGGSTLQCAKAIGLGLPYKGDVWDFWTGKKQPARTAPISSILTVPSSSAELSNACTIVRKGEQKTIRLEELACTFTIMDPTLSMYPLYPTMNQTYELFEHLFFSGLENEGEKEQEAAGLLMRLFAVCSSLEADIQSIPARTDLYRIGLEAHQAFGHTEIGYEDLAERLAFEFSLPGGSAGSALFDAWCTLQNRKMKEKITLLGASVFDLDPSAAGFEEVMECFRRTFSKMKMPLSIPETGLVLNNAVLEDAAETRKEKKLLALANSLVDYGFSDDPNTPETAQASPVQN